MDTTPTFVPTFTPEPTTTAMPGVYGITDPDGATRYVYADSVEAAAAQVQPTPTPIVVPMQPAADLAVPADRPRLVEPWMVRGAAGLGLAGGGIALAPVAASAVSSMSAALGDLLHLAMQVGGLALAALVVVRLLAGRKPGGQQMEVIQTVTQTITNVVRIEK
jgi:hypothetical protein